MCFACYFCQLACYISYWLSSPAIHEPNTCCLCIFCLHWGFWGEVWVPLHSNVSYQHHKDHKTATLQFVCPFQVSVALSIRNQCGCKCHTLLHCPLCICIRGTLGYHTWYESFTYLGNHWGRVAWEPGQTEGKHISHASLVVLTSYSSSKFQQLSI